MNIISLTAESRQLGRSAARATRRAGNVPCILYGRHVDAVPFSASEKSLLPLIHTAEAHLVRIAMGDATWECILKDMAFHPVTDRPMHADFQVLKAGEAVTLTVPVRYGGTSIGQARGGRVQHAITELTVSCLPKHIPTQIDVNVTDIDIGDAIHVRDLKLENLEIGAPGDQILMSVERPRAQIEVDEEDEDEGIEEAPQDE